jgi:hypothetical protein
MASGFGRALHPPADDRERAPPGEWPLARQNIVAGMRAIAGDA